MAMWLEIRCERRGSGRGTFDPMRCMSDDNQGPMGMYADDAASVKMGLATVRRMAIKGGWVQKRGEGWVCPCCLKAEKES